MKLRYFASFVLFFLACACQLSAADTPVSQKQQHGIRSGYLAGDLINIPGGCFRMGDIFGDGSKDEKPVHDVCLSSFAIARYDVTVAQFSDFVQESGYKTDAEKSGGCFVWAGKWEKRADADWRFPGFEQGDNHPVTCVSWNDATAYSQWLSRKNGRTYRLPNEAEWEYACRSGGKAEKYCGSNSIDAIAWYGSNSNSKTHPVGQKQPNGFGLYDMSGNVWQWTQQWYGEYGKEMAPGTPYLLSHSFRVNRGGCWSSTARSARATTRSNGAANGQGNTLGFRLASSPAQ